MHSDQKRGANRDPAMANLADDRRPHFKAAGKRGVVLEPEFGSDRIQQSVCVIYIFFCAVFTFHLQPSSVEIKARLCESLEEFTYFQLEILINIKDLSHREIVISV
jgi:hypothetical protein